MTDLQKLIRIYIADRGIQVMAVLAAGGLTLAIAQRDAKVLGLFALGWALYIVEEYLIHRFIFHAPAPQRQALFDLLYRLHYGHHDQQRNPHLLFTPLWFALPMALITTAALAIVLPLEDAVIAIFGGAVSGYLFFEWLHVTSHFRMPKGRLGHYVTRRHAKHHNIDYHLWFTVSPGGQLVDSALGSDPAKYSVVPNVLTCGLEHDDPRFVKSRMRFGLDSSLTNTPATAARLHSEQAS